MALTNSLQEISPGTIAAISSALVFLEPVPKWCEIDKWDASYKMPAKPFPWSCTMQEGLIMERILRAIRAKNAFEIATAFGFSSLFLGRAVQANNGRLISMDCYIEETVGSCVYSPEELARHVEQVRTEVAAGHLPEGMEVARRNLQLARLENVIDFVVGASPHDVPAHIGSCRLDAALIDGGHFGDQPTQDLEAILPFLEPTCAVFFHDDKNEFVRRAVRRAEAALGSTAVRLDTYYSLTLVARGLDAQAQLIVNELASIKRPWWWHTFEIVKENAPWLKRLGKRIAGR